jgi:hypothetical protein
VRPSIGLFGLSAATGFSGTPRLAQTLEETRAATRARAERFQQRIEMSITHVSYESIVDDDEELLALVRRSTCCDLLLLGQADPSSPGHARSRERLEQVVLQSAAPTLVLPAAGRQPLTANKVMIAWDGSHGAARAVSGALPLLRLGRAPDGRHDAFDAGADGCAGSDVALKVDDMWDMARSPGAPSFPLHRAP